MSLGTALVLGSTGFLGRALVDRLRRGGTDVIALSPSETESVERGLTRVRGSIEDRPLLDRLLAESGVVFFLATRTRPGLSAAAPTLEVSGNLAPLAGFLEAARNLAGRRLVFLSSAGAVYGDGARDAGEETPLRPRSYYGAGKAAAEAFVHAFTAAAAWTGVILRPSNVYGPGQLASKDYAVVPSLFRHALDGTAFPIWGDGLARRDYCFVDDLMDVAVRTVDAPLEARCTVLNACSGSSVSLLDLIATCERVSGRSIRTEFHSPRSVDVPVVSLRAEEARRRLGWKATVDLDEGLRRTWEWFLAAAR
jgi:UDP-glucose 4-epimerase